MLEHADDLIVRDDGPIRHVILNRPQKLNAIDYAQHLRLRQAFIDAEHDESVKVLTLSGEGRGFCSGDDLRSQPYQGDDPHEHRRVDLEMGSGPTLLLESAGLLRSLSIPTVALMHGFALGSGYDYSLSCDFRLMTSDIRYGDPRIDRALWAAEGWSYKLPRLVNLSIVSRIAYLGELLNGDSALKMGLGTGIITAEPDVISSAHEFLHRLETCSGSAYATTKRAMLRDLDSRFASRFGA